MTDQTPQQMITRMQETDTSPLVFTREGTWSYEGVEVVHEAVCQFLAEHLERDHAGRYLVRVEDKSFPVRVEGAPFVVVECLPVPEEDNWELRVRLNDGSLEDVRLETLRVGEDRALYCSVKGDRYEARFNRTTFQVLSRWIETTEDGAGYGLRLGERLIPLVGLQADDSA